ncbi:YceI family protein [Psychroflexus sp. MBR-150]|jgi:polyisoprenoid-binding protein YceI
MKTKSNFTKSILAVIMAFTLVAFTTDVEKKKVNIKDSKIVWSGETLVLTNTGTINLNEGYFEFEKGKIVGGEFTVDMTSINVTNLKGEDKTKLENHLSSEDFFAVDKYPTAKFVINTAAEKSNGVYGISGDMTIKGKTNPIAFDLKVTDNTATTKLVIDRTKYGIKYGSGSFFDNLGDRTIYDEFKLDIKLKF